MCFDNVGTPFLNKGKSVIGRIVVIVVSDVFTSECNRTYCSYCSFRRFYVSQYLNIPRQALIALYYG